MAERFDIPDNFARYMNGLPLNEELAAVQRDAAGQKPKDVSPPAAQTDGPRALPVEDVERELERGERIALKEMVMSPGWAVLGRLMERSFHMKKKGVISISQDDPLGNERRNALAWARLNAFGQAQREIPILVKAEIDAMETVIVRKRA